MKTSKFATTETERKTAADDLIHTEQMDSANTGIVQAKDSSGSDFTSVRKKAVSSLLSDSELEGADDVYYGAKGAYRGAKTAKAVLSGEKSAGDVLKQTFNKRGIAAHAKNAGKGAVSSALGGSELDGLDTEVRGAYKGGKKTVRGIKKAKRKAQEVMRKLQFRRNQAVAMQKVAETKAAASSAGAGVAGGGAGSAGATASVGSGGSAMGCLLAVPLFLIAFVLVLILVGGAFSAFSGGGTDVGSLSGTEAKVAEFLKENGLDNTHTAAILANMRMENGGKPGGEFNSQYENDKGEHGLFKWSGIDFNGYNSAGWKVPFYDDRIHNLVDFAAERGEEWTHFETQLEFFWQQYNDGWSNTFTVCVGSDDPEAGTTVSGSKSKFDSTTDVEEATKQFCYGFAGFAPVDENPRVSKRIEYAEKYFALLSLGGSSSYVENAIAIAEDNTHGYSRSPRDLNPDTDCSGLVWHSLHQAGFKNIGALGDFYTGSEKSILQKAGFKCYRYTGHDDLMPGDILLYRYGSSGHTAIWLGRGGDAEIVEAIKNYDGKKGDSGKKEIRVCNDWADGKWQYYFRLAGNASDGE